MSRPRDTTPIMSEPIGLDLPVMTPKKKRKPRVSAELRVKVYERDRHQCVYCGGNNSLTVDHVKPRTDGGKNTLGNLVTACQPCNNKKADDTKGVMLQQARRYLAKANGNASS